MCVPIDTKKLEKFDPLGVPTVTELLGEIDEWDNINKKEEEGDADISRTQDYEKTSLKPYVEYFKAHVTALLRDDRGVKREREDGDPMEF